MGTIEQTLGELGISYISAVKRGGRWGWSVVVGDDQSIVTTETGDTFEAALCAACSGLANRKCGRTA